MESKFKTKPKVAIVVGLARELKFLKKFRNIKIFQGYSQNALIAAKSALSESPDVIISFGFAGSINPKVPNGKIIIPQKIIDRFGNQRNVSKKYSEFFNKRIIGKVYYDGIYINELLIKIGGAWHYKQYSNDFDLYNAEQSAKKNRLGIWNQELVIPPWEWRKGKRIN